MKFSKNPKGLSVRRSKNGEIIVRLYQTDIVKMDRYMVVLNSGGWRTMHTKKCMNLAFKELSLPMYVYQKKGAWYVELNGKRTVNFIDGAFISI